MLKRFLFVMFAVVLLPTLALAGWTYPTTAACAAHVEFRVGNGPTQSYRISSSSEDPLPPGRPRPKSAKEHASAVLVGAVMREKMALAAHFRVDPFDLKSFPAFGVDRHVCWDGAMPESARQTIASWPAPTWPAPKPARSGLVCRGIVYFRQYVETSDGKELGSWEYRILDGFGLAGPPSAAQSTHDAHLRKLVPAGAFISGPFSLCWDGPKPTSPPIGWNDHASVRW